MKEIYEMKGAGFSIRGIARKLDIVRNTVRRYLKDPEAVMPKSRRRRTSKLDPFIEYMDRRLSEGLENCVVLWRELQELRYQEGYSLAKTYVSPRRRRRQVQATVRFETEPDEQAEVDWGNFSYVDGKGRKRRMWAFVMMLNWSWAIYVELVRRADTASFIQCHVNAFDCLGGKPRRCLYDNAKVVTMGRDVAAPSLVTRAATPRMGWLLLEDSTAWVTFVPVGHGVEPSGLVPDIVGRHGWALP